MGFSLHLSHNGAHGLEKRPRDEESEEWDEYPLGTGHPRSVKTVEREHIKAFVAPVALAATENTLEHVQHSVENGRELATRGGTNLNITVPVIDPTPVVTLASLNAAVLSQFDKALGRLNAKAGAPLNSHVTMNNVNIATNIIASDKSARMTPDTSLLDRVQRVPTGRRSSIPNKRPAPTKPTFAQSAFARSAFSQPAFGQPVFGQTAFSQPTFIQNNSVGTTPTWPRHSGFSVDSKH